MVSFLVDILNQKPLLPKKTKVKSETHLTREAIENEAKY